jgi:hypothetical protein
VGAAFQSDADLRLTLEMPPERGFGALNSPFLDHIPFCVQQAIAAVTVTQIQTRGYLRFADRFHLSHWFANLLHWLVSF